MRGEFIGVWAETSREIWQPLIEQPLDENEGGIPEDIFCELFRALAGDPRSLALSDTLRRSRRWPAFLMIPCRVAGHSRQPA